MLATLSHCYSGGSKKPSPKITVSNLERPQIVRPCGDLPSKSPRPRYSGVPLTMQKAWLRFFAAALLQMAAHGSVGSAVSPDTITPQFLADASPPVLLSAGSDLYDPALVTVRFSEDVLDASDPFVYWLEDPSNPNNFIGVASAAYGAVSNTILLTLNSPREFATTYNLNISQHTIHDRSFNLLPDPSITRLTVPVSFQNDTLGYVGTEDTEVRFSAPDSAAGGLVPIIITDGQDGTPAGAVHGLLRFDNLVGGGPGQLPFGAFISRAALRLYTDDPTDPNTPARMLRMLVPWTEQSTWNSLTNGIDQTNGVETSVTDALIVATQDETFITVDVTAAIQAWVNGQPNYGWAFLPSGPNGWRWVSSENGTADRRPALLVEFLNEPPPCPITEQPQSQTVYVGAPITLGVLSIGSNLRYEWYKNRVPIPGASNSVYRILSSKPSDSGGYSVVVRTPFDPSAPCTSQVAQVTVLCNSYPVNLLSAIGSSDQTTIVLSFNATLNPVIAQNTNNYAISGALGISRAIQVATNQVALTTTGPRIIGRNYSLTISNLQDADCANLLFPNPTVAALTQDVRILSFGATWRYQNDGTDLGATWRVPQYDDSFWAQGPGLLGFETTQTTLSALSNQNARVGTVLNIVKPSGQSIITAYFRTLVNLPFDTSAVMFTIQHVVDDGAVFYFNGAEAARFNMPTGYIDYLTVAPTGPLEGIVRSITDLTGVTCGLNSFAVEVHNQAPTSGDLLFGAELIARVPFFVAPFCGPGIRIFRNIDGTLRLEWVSRIALLQQADVLGDWRDIPEATSPWPLTPTQGTRFYRLR